MHLAMRTPTLKKHTTGVWFTYWGGRSRYFSVDEKASRSAFLAHLQMEWMPWQQQRERRRLAPKGTQLTIADLAQLWLEYIKANRRDEQTIRHYAQKLKGFLHAFGTLYATDFDAEMLLALRADVSHRYGAKSLNHMTSAVKMLFTWGHDIGRLPTPINLRIVRKLPTDPADPLVYTPAQLAAFMAACHTGSAQLAANGRGHRSKDWLITGPLCAAWIALGYLTAARPTELLRLSLQQGRIVLSEPSTARPLVYRLDRSKTGRSTGLARHLLITAEAWPHLQLIWRDSPARWASLNSVSDALRKVIGPHKLPHHCRHSAATFLRRSGALEEDVRQILGHKVRGELRNYEQIAHERLLPIMARLTLQPCPLPSLPRGDDPSHPPSNGAD